MGATPRQVLLRLERAPRRTYAALVLVYAASLFAPTQDFADGALFGGDVTEYQSMAVNLLLGHGVSRDGGIAPFKTYLFTHTDAQPTAESEVASFQARDRFNIYRTPGYPVFLAGVYRVFGTSPRRAKQVQCLLVILVAAGLPWLGGRLWGHRGFAAGLLASPIYMVTHWRIAQTLMTEALVTAWLFLLVVLYLWWSRLDRHRAAGAALNGAAFGIGLLIKGIIAFLPPLLALGHWWVGDPEGRRRRATEAALMLAFCVAVVLPWSLYASERSGERVWLGTMSRTLLLDSHNESSVRGSWKPAWRRDRRHPERYFYNRDGLAAAPSLVRVANFYRFHPELAPRIFYNKLVRGFGSLYFMVLFVLSGLGWLALGALSPGPGRRRALVGVWSLIVAAGVLHAPSLLFDYQLVGIIRSPSTKTVLELANSWAAAPLILLAGLGLWGLRRRPEPQPVVAGASTADRASGPAP